MLHGTDIEIPELAQPVEHHLVLVPVLIARPYLKKHGQLPDCGRILVLLGKNFQSPVRLQDPVRALACIHHHSQFLTGHPPFHPPRCFHIHIHQNRRLTDHERNPQHHIARIRCFEDFKTKSSGNFHIAPAFRETELVMHIISPCIEGKVHIGDIGLVNPVHILDLAQRGKRAISIKVHYTVTQSHIPILQIIETDRQVIGTPQIDYRQRLVIRIGRFDKHRSKPGRCLRSCLRQHPHRQQDKKQFLHYENII